MSLSDAATAAHSANTALIATVAQEASTFLFSSINTLLNLVHLALAFIHQDAPTKLTDTLTHLAREAFTWPFGLFNTLHWHIINNAVGFTPLGIARYLAPLALMYAQCYLLLEPGTRYTRLALGAACLAGMWTAWTSTRFTSKSPYTLSTMQLMQAKTRGTTRGTMSSRCPTSSSWSRYSSSPSSAARFAILGIGHAH